MGIELDVLALQLVQLDQLQDIHARELAISSAVDRLDHAVLTACHRDVGIHLGLPEDADYPGFTGS